MVHKKAKRCCVDCGRPVDPIKSRPRLCLRCAARRNQLGGRVRLFLIFECATCGKEKVDYITNRKSRRLFCSQKCRRAWVGAHNSLSRGGDGIQRTKKARDAIDYRRHADSRRLKAKRRYAKNRLQVLAGLKTRGRALKVEVITAYGGRCVCCGETYLEFLTIDHANGDGAAHRRKNGKGRGIYLDLKARGFPQEGYRCMCFNCNISLGFYGYCPHKPDERRYVDKRPQRPGRPLTVA